MAQSHMYVSVQNSDFRRGAPGCCVLFGIFHYAGGLLSVFCFSLSCPATLFIHMIILGPQCGPSAIQGMWLCYIDGDEKSK